MSTELNIGRQAETAETSEKALICTLLKVAEHQPDAMGDVQQIVSAGDFLSPNPRKLFEIMSDLYNRNEPFDVVGITPPAQQAGLDVSALMEFYNFDQYLVTRDPLRYAHKVREASERRRLITAGERIALLGRTGDYGTSRELFDEAEKVLSGAEPVQINAVGPVGIMTLMPGYLEQLKAMKNSAAAGEIAMGIVTGYGYFDALTKGLHPKNLYIIAARPSVGKTAFAINLLTRTTLRPDVHGIMFSGEMSKDKPLLDRFVSCQAMVRLEQLQTGLLSDEEMEKVENAVGRMSNRLDIDDTPALSITHIRREARRIRRRIGPHMQLVIVVDYLQLVHGPKHLKAEYEKVSYVSQALKELARELNAAVIALSQLSRESEKRQDKRPILADLRGSGQIEQAGDLIGFLFREDYYEKDVEFPGMVELIIAKQRNGPLGTAYMDFVKDYGVFRTWKGKTAA